MAPSVLLILYYCPSITSVKPSAKRTQYCWRTTPNNVGRWELLRPLIFTWLKVWPVSNFAQQLPTTRNNRQQGVQTDATFNIQQCWELLANNVASVCTGLMSLAFDGKMNTDWSLKNWTTQHVALVTKLAPFDQKPIMLCSPFDRIIRYLSLS